MNIEQMQYICMVAKTNSITVAAENLFVTQQTVSKAINKLEVELGKQLLVRSHKGVTLTEEGQLFVAYANKIVEEFQDLYVLMRQDNQSDAINGDIHLQCSPYFTSVIIPSLLANCYRLFPQVNIAVEERLCRDIIEDISQQDEGFGLITSVNDNTGFTRMHLLESVIDCQLIYTDELIVYVAKNNPLAKKKKVTLKEITQYPLCWSECPGFESILSDDFGVTAKVLINSHNQMLHVKAVAEGIAIGFSTEIIARNSELSEEFVYVSVTEQPKILTWVIKSKGYELNQAQLTLVDEAKRVLHSL